jgi:N-carbamoylputrescine amidase
MVRYGTVSFKEVAVKAPTRRAVQAGFAASLLGSPQASAAPRTLRLAVAQMRSADGDIEGNLRQATHWARAAHADGAELILFPEFMPTGYALNPSLWEAAEPRVGPTVQWLCATARALRCAIGTSFLEAEGDAHFNTFVLAGADGNELRRVRKETPASLEAAFFRGEINPHIIDTPFARIGVGICYESYLCSLERHFAAGRPDLILLPHSYPDMSARGGLASPPGTHVALWHARRFGVPVAMANKVGAWSTMTPAGQAEGQFPGQSAIIDSDGATRAAMNGEAGVAVAQVALDAARKAPPRPACEGELIPDLARFDWLRTG